MEKTVQQAYDEYISLLYELLISNCPIDTGNMQTHIRMNNDGKTCEIIIDTIPYYKSGKSIMRKIRKRQHTLNPKEVEYAAYTEYRNQSKGWVREDSIKTAATITADVVDYRL